MSPNYKVGPERQKKIRREPDEDPRSTEMRRKNTKKMPKIWP